MSGDRDAIRVLVIDESPLIRDAWSALLSGAGGMTVVATLASPSEALLCAVEATAHIVLIGVFDPERLFLTAEQILRSNAGTKLVFLDQRVVDCHVREALRIGAAGYLTRQQSFREIKHALRQIAGGQRVFVPEVACRLSIADEGVRLPFADRQHPLATLTPRENEVLVLLSRGHSVKQCANILHIGANTVGNHKARLMKKLDVHKSVELTHLAIREGIIGVTPPSDDCLSPMARCKNDLHIVQSA